VDIERRWRSVAGLDRLVFSADRTKSALAITEIRLRPAKSADPTWDGATELGLAVVAHTLHIGDGKMTVVPDPVAVISLHALARRVQRGFRRDDAAVLEDIACLIPVAPAALMAGGEFRIPAGDREWAGEHPEAVAPSACCLPCD